MQLLVHKLKNSLAQNSTCRKVKLFWSGHWWQRVKGFKRSVNLKILKIQQSKLWSVNLFYCANHHTVGTWTKLLVKFWLWSEESWVQTNLTTLPLAVAKTNLFKLQCCDASTVNELLKVALCHLFIDRKRWDPGNEVERSVPVQSDWECGVELTESRVLFHRHCQIVKVN